MSKRPTLREIEQLMRGRPIMAGIIHDAEGLIVVAKPAGLPSTGRDLSDPNCVQWRLMAHFRRPRIWAVHQLDADTSGLNLFVKRKALVGTWQARLSQGRKRYLALCHGFPDFEQTVIDEPIGDLRVGRHWRKGVTESGKQALTRVWVRARGPAHCLLEVEIETGRTHQIRIHLAHIGHPLVGESRYRDPPCHLHSGHVLHASEIWFDKGVEPRRLEASPPPSFEELVERLVG